MRSGRWALARGLATGVIGAIVGLVGPMAAVQASPPARAARPMKGPNAHADGGRALVRGTSVSSNWSGYAIHRSHLEFRKVSGEWIEPSGACQTSRTATYSAFWIGLGGYQLSSRALEQIGTELDCTASGRVRLSAWYELVPAPSRRIRMRVAPGDLMRAQVVVAGYRVRMTLTDLTRGESFTKRATDRSTDVTSAEWIAEAPSVCFDSSRCQVLPLADFGSIGFTAASAETRSFHSGGIASGRWKRTKILLGNAYGRRYVSTDSGSTLARPSALSSDGHAFTIRYTGVPGESSAAVSAGGTEMTLARAVATSAR